MRRIRNLASIFVEGVTDRVLYKTFFTKVLGYDEVKDDELEILQQEMKFGGELVPLKDSIVLHSKTKDSLVVIKNKNGKDELFKFARENVNAIRPLKRQVKEPLKFGNFFVEIKSLFIAYIFDRDVDADKLEELRRLYADHEEVLIETHTTPEELTLENFENHFLNEHQDWRKWLNECSEKLKRLFPDHPNKRKFVLIKAMIGERCYYQLFEELFNKEKVRKDLIDGQINWINNLSGIV